MKIVEKSLKYLRDQAVEVKLNLNTCSKNLLPVNFFLVNMSHLLKKIQCYPWRLLDEFEGFLFLNKLNQFDQCL